MKKHQTRLILSILALMFVPIICSAETLIPDQNKKGKWGFVNESGKVVIKYNYDEVTAFDHGVSQVRKGEKWGYIGTNGREVLKIEYDEIGTFKNGLAHIIKGGKYGYINDQKEIVIPAKYTAIGKFNVRNLTWVAEGGKMNNGTLTGAKYGVYNRKGEIVIKPSYKALGTFSLVPFEANPALNKLMSDTDLKKLTGDKELVEKVRSNSLRLNKEIKGLVLTAGVDNNYLTDQSLIVTGDELIDVVKYASTSTDGSEAAIENAQLLRECDSYDMLGYSFLTGKLFDELNMDLSTYLAVSNRQVTAGQKVFQIATAKVDKIGIIDAGGDIVIKPGEYDFAMLPSDGLVPVAKTKKKKYEVNYFSIKDQKLLFKKWITATCFTPFHDGCAVIANDNIQYIINRSGDKISDEYTIILPPKNNVFIVSNGTKYGLIDGNGKEIVAPTKRLILPENDGLLCFRDESGKYGYMRANGQEAIAPVYDRALSFDGGYAAVTKGDKCGLIDTYNRVVVDFNWKSIISYSSDNGQICWVSDGEKWQAIDVKTGKAAFSSTYNWVTNYTDEKIAFISNDKKEFGCINDKGEIIVPIGLKSLQLANDCYEDMVANGKTKLEYIDVYRFNARHNPDRNLYRLSGTVESDLWDY